MGENTPRVAVVGTGVVGAMAAWQLARRGADVVAFDTHGPGHDRGASAGESRIFRTAYKEGVAYVPLLQRALELWRGLEALCERDLLLLRGGLTVGAPDQPDLAAVIACAHGAGLPHEVLDRDEMARRFPQHRLDPGEIGVLDPGAGVLRPELAVQAALTAASAAGATLRPRQHVEDVRRTSSGWRLSAGEESVDVDHLVLSPGPWATSLPILAGIPVETRMMTACWFPAVDMSAYVSDRFPIGFRRHADGGFSCFPSLDGVSVKILPHHLEWPEVDPDQLPRSVGPDVTARAAAAVSRLLPGLVPDPIRIGTYVEGFLPDGHGVVGPLPGEPAATVLTGFSAHGFKLAPVLGEIAADLVLDQWTSHDIDLLDPSRWTRRP